MTNNIIQEIQQFLLMILPSSKLNNDVNIQYNQCSVLKPISIKELSLTFPMKRKILNIRKNNAAISIAREQKKLTLIIPYRNRQKHLEQFLPFIQNILNQQNINYEIIVAEQDDTNFFNRAKLMNVAVLHANQESDYFIFHDVDALPYNVDYRYCNQTVKTFNYIKREQEYEEYPQTVFGGVTLVPKDIFYSINGFSNHYWQWGKEDDDFLLRHLLKGYIPFFDNNGKLDMLPHPRALMTDNEGNETQDKEIIQRNKVLSDTNKKIFSKFKRGLTSQYDDGINNVKDYVITSTTVEDRVKTIKIQFTNI